MKFGRRYYVFAALTVVLIFIALWALGAVLLHSDAPTAVTVRRIPTLSATPPANIGDQLRDGELLFSVTSIQCGVPAVGEGSGVQAAQGQFCVVGMTIRNAGDAPRVISDSNMTGQIGATDYRPDGAADLALGDTLWLTLLPPDGVTAGKIAFDLPAGVKLDRVILRESATSPGVVIAVR